MITGQDFVVLSDDWNGLPTSCIHLFRQLSRDNRVFWFNTLTRLPRPSLADARKVVRALSGWTRRPSPQEQDNVTVVRPVMVPWFRRPFRRFNAASFLRTYRKVECEYDLRDPVVVTTFPCAVDFVREVEASCKLYYCVDDFPAYPGIDTAAWVGMETELLESCDALAVVSRELARTRHTRGPTLHLPHGVDLDHYLEATSRPRPVPALDALPKPVVGFFGLIEEWIDLELIAYLARTFPHASFALVGRTARDLSALNGIPNVHYFGWVPYAELPHYGRRFDVGLIPYDIRDERLRTVNPLKLMEYFALGLPVVATRLPELERVTGPIRLASTRDEFRVALAEVLAEGPDRFADDALAAARENTWEERAERLSGFLATLGADGHTTRGATPCATGLSS